MSAVRIRQYAERVAVKCQERPGEILAARARVGLVEPGAEVDVDEVHAGGVQFDQRLPGGGPGRSTYTVAYVIYTFAFQDKNYGYASAVAICLLIVILFIHLIQTLFFKEKD